MSTSQTNFFTPWWPTPCGPCQELNLKQTIKPRKCERKKYLKKGTPKKPFFKRNIFEANSNGRVGFQAFLKSYQGFFILSFYFSVIKEPINFSMFLTSPLYKENQLSCSFWSKRTHIIVNSFFLWLKKPQLLFSVSPPPGRGSPQLVLKDLYPVLFPMCDLQGRWLASETSFTYEPICSGKEARPSHAD